MNSAAPALVSVIGVLIQDFARQPVTEQDRLKAQAADLLVGKLGAVPAAQRVLLDANGGFAVALLGRPGAALELAAGLRRDAHGLPLCIGINHGPVTISEDANRGLGLAGDGLSTAMTLAGTATPDRVIASRSFHDAIEADSPGSATRLIAAGQHTDAQVRAHELYTPDDAAPRRRRARLAVIGALACAGIVGLGVGARLAHKAFVEPAVIVFKVSPPGSVYVDGVLKGNTPPLTRLEIAPGKHTIEVRNSGYPPLTLDIHPGPAEELTIAHNFAKGKAATRSAKGSGSESKSIKEEAREGWRSFRRSVGF
jgi:hypothetical protein